MSIPLRIVLILFGLSLLGGAMTGNQIYYRLSYLWGLLIGASWLISWSALRGIEVRRTARSLRSQVGYVFEERYEIINTGRLPRLWIEVRDESPLPETRGSHVLTSIKGREMRTYLSRTRLQERGDFPLGPTRLISGDPFGLFPVERVYANPEALVVYPRLYDVYHFPSPPGLLPGGEALRRRTPQITSNAAGVREYAPGDPLNRIHWVSTARRNRLIVKEFELDPLAEVWLFIDAAQHIHQAEPYEKKGFDPGDFWRKRTSFELPPSTEEYAVSIAGSLARFYLQRGRAVGAVAAGHTLHILPADRGGRQLVKILETLALLRADGRLPIQGLVEAQARHLLRGSTVVLITTSVAQHLFQSVDMLQRRGLRPVVVVVDASTFGGTYQAEQSVKALQFLRIPVCQVNKGDDLTQVLSETVNLRPLI